jgi:aryl sulfotransferase
MWPSKSREVRNFTSDSARWNDIRFREGDIVVASYAKTGTTWVQQIVAQLIFGGEPEIEIQAISPFVDSHVGEREDLLAMLESQNHRRFMKTHLPLDALVFSPRAKYLYVARDGRDVAWSIYDHHANANDTFYELINGAPGRDWPLVDRPTMPVSDYFRRWLKCDGYPLWPFWAHVRSWWEYRMLPNLYFCHFSRLKVDLSGEIRKIAKFLEISVDEANWQAILNHSTFGFMKENAVRYAPNGGAFWHGGASAFINRGDSGRWREWLSDDDIAEYEYVAEMELGAECARWLATGESIPA